jgi:hypothetical protein
MKVLTSSILFFLIWPFAAWSALYVTSAKPKTTGQKTMIKLDVQNTFSEKVQSVRATIFLLDPGGKMSGQATHWIIGGSTNRPSLAANAHAVYYFVVPVEKPFAKVQMMIDRIVLESGRAVNMSKDVVIKNEGEK